jgi:hypothetical protein
MDIPGDDDGGVDDDSGSLCVCWKSPVALLEVGMGTGSSASLSQNSRRIE